MQGFFIQTRLTPKLHRIKAISMSMQSRDVQSYELSTKAEVEPVGKWQCLRIARECLLGDLAGR